MNNKSNRLRGLREKDNEKGPETMTKIKNLIKKLKPQRYRRKTISCNINNNEKLFALPKRDGRCDY